MRAEELQKRRDRVTMAPHCSPPRRWSEPDQSVGAGEFSPRQMSGGAEEQLHRGSLGRGAEIELTALARIVGSHTIAHSCTLSSHALHVDFYWMLHVPKLSTT